MMTLNEFALPDVGEGLREAEIVSWRVRVGEVVEVNQPLVEIETAKSLVELPSPYAGEVAELLAAEGETVDVGRAIVRIATLDALAEARAGALAEAPAGALAEAPAGLHAEDAGPEQPALLVGYGPATPTRRRPHSPSVIMQKRTGRPLTTPPVRKLARDLGVDLAALSPTGPGGTITRDDVRRAVPDQHPDVLVPAADGDVRIPVRGVRKATAAAMVGSAFTAPHVTEFVTVDVSPMMELKDAIAARREFTGVKLSPLVLVARALLSALRRTPEANARWDDGPDGAQIVRFGSVNLGIAAATPRGLVVPNIKDAQRLSLLELATAITDLAVTARDGRTQPAALTGGTLTITNVGVFGVDTGTPILNPGEAAILALGAIRRMPWVVGEGDAERIEPRWVTQLALSFDHRVLDGEQGSRLLADTAAILHEPGLAQL